VANTQAPFGFEISGINTGSAPNFRLSRRLIAATYATQIFSGDPVADVASSLTGYISVAAAGTTQLSGVFWGCKYYSTSQQKTVWNNYWPGADATGDVEAYVYDAPDAIFRVQAGGTAIGMSNLHENIQFALGTGNTTTGRSGAYVQSPNTTSTLPFIVVGFDQDPTGLNGTDITTAYNNIYVAWNLQVFKAGLTSLS
jgi:hypothetical protein